MSYTHTPIGAERNQTISTMSPDHQFYLDLWLFFGFLIFAGWTIGFTYAGAQLGFRKNAQNFGAVMGLLFGPIGLVIAALADFRPKCPYCASPLYSHRRPRICSSCNGKLLWPAGQTYALPDESLNKAATG